MRVIVSGILAVLICASASVAQQKDDQRRAFREAKRAALAEVMSIKRLAKTAQTVDLLTNAANAVELYDQESFDKQVVFLGALYAGSVYVDDFTPFGAVGANGCPTDPTFGFGADDHCIQKDPNTNTGAPQIIFDPAWEVTIPKNKVKNVIYPMLNNTVSIGSNGTVFTGIGGFGYGPVVTVVSEAFNSPQAIVNGSPLNGSFTTTLTGSLSRVYGNPGAAVPFSTDTQSYASVAGRGISRDFWRALGLPESVINDFYKKEITLKFGIRYQVRNSPDSGLFFYTFRLLGQ